MLTAIKQAMRLLPTQNLIEFGRSIVTREPLFADGMYARVVERKRGVTIVGKVHKREHFYIITKGAVLVTDGGSIPVLRVAGDVIVSKAGTERAVFALEDSICMTVHRTDKTDLDEIEAELIEPDPLAFFDAANRLKFDPEAFRELTQKVIAGEKPGFWSDWTSEEQRLYLAGEWRAFSKSRGYSDQAIAEYGEWLGMVKTAQDLGLDPYEGIADLAIAAGRKNVALDTRGEILKSSYLPFERGEKL